MLINFMYIIYTYFTYRTYKMFKYIILISIICFVCLDKTDGMPLNNVTDEANDMTFSIIETCTSYNYPKDICLRDQTLANQFINCTDDSSCSYRGRCNVRNTGCFCDSGYATFEPEEGTQCNYHQMSRFLPFFLQFFLGEFGVGHFVLKNNGYGVGQLLLFIFGNIFIQQGKKEKKDNLVTLGGMCILAWAGWWLESVIRIGTGYYTDGNGVETYW